MAKYDVYNIEARLKEYDPEMFRRIDWDDKRNLHKIICWDPEEREEYTAFTVPHGKLDHRTACDFMRINPRNGYNPFEEIDKSLEQKVKCEDQKISDMAQNLADNLYDSFRMKPSRTVE